RAAQGSELREFDPAPVRAQRPALAHVRVPGAGRHLHAAGVPAQAALRRGRAVSQLAGRLLLSVPRLAIRPRRPGVLRLARLDESRGAALSIPERAHARDRGGREGGGLMGVKTAAGAPARLPGADATGRGSLWIWLNKRLPIGELDRKSVV